MPAAVDQLLVSLPGLKGIPLADDSFRIDSLAPESTSAFSSLVFIRFFFLPEGVFISINKTGLVRFLILVFLTVRPSLSALVLIVGGLRRSDSSNASFMTSSKLL
jgi:hypothetical protein